MASKFDNAHAEIRLYLPLHDLKNIQELNLADLLNQAKVQTYQPKKKRKGANNAQTHDQ